MSKDSSELAKKFIDASLKTPARQGKRQPSKAAYGRAVRLAQRAIDELTHVARRAQGRA